MFKLAQRGVVLLRAAWNADLPMHSPRLLIAQCWGSSKGADEADACHDLVLHLRSAQCMQMRLERASRA